MRSIKGAAVAGLAAAMSLACPGLGCAAPAAAAAAAARAETYTFAFHDAPIGMVVDEILGKTLGLDYQVDPQVTGTISFRIDQRLTRAQLLEAFEAALSANGVAMVRNGNTVVVTPRDKARQSAGIHAEGPGGLQGGYEVVAVPLTYAIPSEVAKALEAMGRKDIVVYTDDKLGLIILGGTARELDAAGQTLKVLDQSGLQSSRIRWYDLNQAPADVVGRELDQILRASGSTGIAIVPLRRLNGILVFARTPEGLDQVGVWLRKLDAPSKEETSGIYIYHPAHLSADALATSLGRVLGGTSDQEGDASSAAPPQPGAERALAGIGQSAVSAQLPSAQGTKPENAVRIGASHESNTLIVTAPPSRWIQMKRVLDELDRTPQQVLIEASVVEVTLDNSLQFGVDWSVVSAHNKFTASNITSNATGAIAAAFPALSVTYLSKDISAAVNALRSITNVEVVSRPRLIALDNRPAKLQVGDQVPIVTRTAQSVDTPNAPLVSNTDYRDTGVILNVTPRVSGEDQMVLDIDQEVSAVTKTTTSGIDSPTIQQRRMQSTVILQDGATIALGGLISNRRDEGRNGAPILGDLPVVGGLFRTTTHETKRTELIVLITAHIIKDGPSRERVMSDLLADMQEIHARGLLKP